MGGIYRCLVWRKREGCGGSLGLRFLICAMGIIILPSQKVGFNEVIPVKLLEIGTEWMLRDISYYKTNNYNYNDDNNYYYFFRPSSIDQLVKYREHCLFVVRDSVWGDSCLFMSLLDHGTPVHSQIEGCMGEGVLPPSTPWQLRHVVEIQTVTCFPTQECENRVSDSKTKGWFRIPSRQPAAVTVGLAALPLPIFQAPSSGLLLINWAF